MEGHIKVKLFLEGPGRVVGEVSTSRYSILDSFMCKAVIMAETIYLYGC